MPLVPTTIFGTDIACINSNIEYQTPLIPNQTNQWNLGTSGILTENKEKANVIWKKTGAQVINLKAVNLCGTSPNLVKIVNVSSIPSDFVITGDTTVCLVLERYSIPSSENGVNYQWNLNNGGLISATGSNCSINWTTTGVHILTVSSTNFCGSGIVQILKVSVRTVPESVSQIFGDTVACRGISNYFVNNTTSNFNWSISGGGFISPLANSANVNWTQTGKFKIIISPSNSCGNGISTQLNVSILSIPGLPTIVNSFDSVVCLGLKTYTVVNQGHVYNWQLENGGNIISQVGNNATVQWTNTGRNTIKVSASNLCGISLTKTQFNQIISVPEIFSITGDSIVCSNVTKFYTASQSIFPRNLTWKIIESNKNISFVNTAQINFSISGVYNLSVSSENLFGFGISKIQQIRVISTPTGVFSIRGDSSTCLQSVSYKTVFMPKVNYNWNIPNGVSSILNQNTATILWDKPGNFTITCTPFNFCGNGQSSTKKIQVTGRTFFDFSIIGLDSVCTTFNLFQVDSLPNVNYTWNTTGRSQIRNLSNFKKEIKFENDGNYSISVIPSNNCEIGLSKTKNIKVTSLPLAPEFSQTLNSICRLDTISIFINNPKEKIYKWAKSNEGFEQSLNHRFIFSPNKTGNYIISSTGVNTCGDGQLSILRLNVLDKPNFNSFIVGDTIQCTFKEIVYSTSQNVAENLVWAIEPNTNFTTFKNTISVKWINDGPYIISAEYKNECGFSNKVSKNINLISVPKIPQIFRKKDILYSTFKGKNIWLYNSEIISKNTDSINTNFKFGLYNVIAINDCGPSLKSEDFYYGDFNNFGFQLIPNPASTNVLIKVPWFLNWSKIELISTIGINKLETLNTNNINEVYINLLGLNSGFYLVKLYTELGEYTRKLVVIR